MEFIEKYWWLILIFLIGVLINHLVELSKVDHKPYLKKRQQKAEENLSRLNKRDDEP